MEFSAVILAGGNSSRMGRDKAWLEFRGRRLITYQLQTVGAAGARELFISSRRPEDYATLGWPVLADNFAEAGPLGGIESALQAITTPLLLVLAVDMPRLTPRRIRWMLARCGPRLGLVPRVVGRVQPLAAFYPKTAWGTARQFLGDGLNSASGFAECCEKVGLVRWWDAPAARARDFENWNRPEDVPVPRPRR